MEPEVCMFVYPIYTQFLDKQPWANIVDLG